MNLDDIKNIVNNSKLMEIGRKAIEDQLLLLRDARVSSFQRSNGLVICEPDGQKSHVIRMGTETALAIGLNAILYHLEGEEK